MDPFHVSAWEVSHDTSDQVPFVLQDPLYLARIKRVSLVLFPEYHYNLLRVAVAARGRCRVVHGARAQHVLAEEEEGRVGAAVPAIAAVASPSQPLLLLALERHAGVHPRCGNQLPKTQSLLSQLLDRIQARKQLSLEVGEHVGVVGFVQSQHLMASDRTAVEQRLERAVPRHETEVHVLARTSEDVSGLFHPRIAVVGSSQVAPEGLARHHADGVEPLRDEVQRAGVGAPAVGVRQANELGGVAPGGPLVPVPPRQGVVRDGGSEEDVLERALSHHGGIDGAVATDLASAAADVQGNRERVFDEVPTEGACLPHLGPLCSGGPHS